MDSRLLGMVNHRLVEDRAVETGRDSPHLVVECSSNYMIVPVLTDTPDVVKASYRIPLLQN